MGTLTGVPCRRTANFPGDFTEAQRRRALLGQCVDDLVICDRTSMACRDDF